MKDYSSKNNSETFQLCEPLAKYSWISSQRCKQNSLFDNTNIELERNDITIIELFAGVGGFRIGFERASQAFKTIWSNQWEPSTKRQDASNIYCARFGIEGHSNSDIELVPTEDIPDADILCAGFPCQDYSVATTLSNSKGIEGKKGVLWWQIERILREKKSNAPKYLVLENVDRLLSSPAKQRGRDFAIILASLSDLGYLVEWRVINAADYGMPQRRKRTYIIGYHKNSKIAQKWRKERDTKSWVLKDGILATAFLAVENEKKKGALSFVINGDLLEITESFNTSNNKNAISPFGNAGFMDNRNVWTTNVSPVYDGPSVTLGELLVPENMVPEDFFISNEDLKKWVYLKGGKSEKRKSKSGYEYNYSEGNMTFPDTLDRPSRTIITGEGGSAPSRFKHVIKTKSGKYRRLIPIELERLNMFPDNHTKGASDSRRAFLMGNALVTGIVEQIAIVLKERLL